MFIKYYAIKIVLFEKVHEICILTKDDLSFLAPYFDRFELTEKSEVRRILIENKFADENVLSQFSEILYVTKCIRGCYVLNCNNAVIVYNRSLL